MNCEALRKELHGVASATPVRLEIEATGETFVVNAAEWRRGQFVLKAGRKPPSREAVAKIREAWAYWVSVLVLLAAIPCSGMDAAQANRLADAIYKAEGGAQARVPYGILSVKVRDAAEARRVCLNTIRNNHARWIRAGQPGPFIHFLADRYCPPSADPVGNRNWKRNVEALCR